MRQSCEVDAFNYSKEFLWQGINYGGNFFSLQGVERHLEVNLLPRKFPSSQFN